jgi:ABC-2 type transport system ATP-binding protein
MDDPGLAIRLEGLTRVFGDRAAVDHLTLDVPAGGIFGFLGPNGAGKTTTISLLLGLLEPTSGRALVLGRDPRLEGDAVRSQAGALLEHPGVYDELSTEDNLEFYARAWSMPAGERRERIRELLTRFDLWADRRKRAGILSTGMRQRLALARAMLHRPALLFLDEPTAGLDVMAATAIRADLARLAANDGTTIFLTTHNMAEAEALCASIAVIREGQLLALGSPAELRRRTGTPRIEISAGGLDDGALRALEHLPEVVGVHRANGHVVVDCTPAARSADLVRTLVERGVEVDEVRHGLPSLEEVFVTLMEEEP